MTMLSNRDRLSLWLSSALAAAGLALAAALVYADCRIAADAGDAAQKTVVAEFTGELERGTPVYRLPSISVSVKRSVLALETPQKRHAAVDGTHRTPAVRSRSPS